MNPMIPSWLFFCLAMQCVLCVYCFFCRFILWFNRTACFCCSGDESDQQQFLLTVAECCWFCASWGALQLGSNCQGRAVRALSSCSSDIVDVLVVSCYFAGGYTRYLTIEMGDWEWEFRCCKSNHWGFADHQGRQRKMLGLDSLSFANFE